MKYSFMRFPEGRAKAFTISYDDGAKADERLCEIIDKYKIKGTFNLSGANFGTDFGVSVDFVKEKILAGGHEVANHGQHHRALGYIRDVEGIHEMLDSRLCLEKEFGRIIRGFAYPDRMANRFKMPERYAEIKSYLKQLGIVYARAAGGDEDTFEMPDDFYYWVPTCHHKNRNIFEKLEKFVSLDVSKLYIAARTPKLFYMWGHSFEFEGDNNWDRLEEICEKVAFKDDIWYATNMEIYLYTEAYHSLVYSADGSMIYNPTLYRLWFDVDGKLYSIEPGETLNI